MVAHRGAGGTRPQACSAGGRVMWVSWVWLKDRRTPRVWLAVACQSAGAPRLEGGPAGGCLGMQDVTASGVCRQMQLSMLALSHPDLTKALQVARRSRCPGVRHMAAAELSPPASTHIGITPLPPAARHTHVAVAIRGRAGRGCGAVALTTLNTHPAKTHASSHPIRSPSCARGCRYPRPSSAWLRSSCPRPPRRRQPAPLGCWEGSRGRHRRPACRTLQQSSSPGWR